MGSSDRIEFIRDAWTVAGGPQRYRVEGEVVAKTFVAAVGRADKRSGFVFSVSLWRHHRFSHTAQRIAGC
jgi:hypothetical protein